MKKRFGIAAMLAAIAGIGLNQKSLAGMDWSFRAPSLSSAGAVNPKTIGDILFDTSDSKFKGWNGGAWVNFEAGSQPNMAIRSVTSTDSATTSDDILIMSGSSFTETLYDASIYTGKVITLIHNGTSQSQVYSLATVSGQTIGGIASGNYSLYTNGEIVKLVSDGSNWLILEHKTATAWQDFPSVAAGTLITGTTTNPSYGTTSINKAQWRRNGTNMEIRWDYRQTSTTGATAGSGIYLFNLPSGYAMDTSKVSVNTGTTLVSADSLSLGSFKGLRGTSVIDVGHVGAYSSTQLKVVSSVTSSSNTSDAYPWGSSVGFNNSGTMVYGLTASLPMSGWQP